MDVWQIWSCLALLLVGAPAALWAQGPPATSLASPFALPDRADSVMPVPPPAGRSPVLAPAMPARPAPLGLAQLESLAQTYNPILRRDVARIEAAHGSALQAGLYPNPRFDSNNPEIFAGRN